MIMIKSLIMKIKSWFIEKPTRRLTWSPEDYELGKRWVSTQPHPYMKGRTAWDFVYDYRDSTYTLNNMNKFLFNEI